MPWWEHWTPPTRKSLIDAPASTHGEFGTVPDVRIVGATIAQKPVVRHLLELYQHDLSEFDSRDVDARGLYDYAYIDDYWVDADRRPFLVEADGRWAGFALVRLGPPIDMSEFFVVRRFRRLGVGQQAALQLFREFPGTWQIRQLPRNPGATAFWRSVIPVEYRESKTEDGLVQHFVIPSG